MRQVVAALLVLILAGQSMVAFSSSAPVVNACCGHCKHCGMSACCAKQSVPSAPARAPVSQIELQVLALPMVSVMALPETGRQQCEVESFSSDSMMAIPLFQRHCCYLL